MATKNFIFSSNSSTANNNTLTLKFDLQPFVAKDLEVSLTDLFVSYLWNNVSSTLNNGGWSYTWNGVLQGPYTLPDGQYRMSDMQGVIQLQMFTNNHYVLDSNGAPYYFILLQANSVYNACTITSIPLTLPTGGTNPKAITLSGNCPLLTLSAGLSTLLGYSGPITLPAVTQATTYMVNSTKNPVMSPVFFVSVGTNMCSAPEYNSFLPSCIYIFSSSVATGSQIQLSVTNQRWFPVLDGIYRTVTVSLSGQDGSALPLKDPNWACNLQLRKRPYLNP
jgi:hypothetical protein